MTASKRSNSFRKKTRRPAAKRLLDDLLATTGGPLTRKERQTADRVLGLRKRRP